MFSRRNGNPTEKIRGISEYCPPLLNVRIDEELGNGHIIIGNLFEDASANESNNDRNVSTLLVEVSAKRAPAIIT